MKKALERRRSKPHTLCHCFSSHAQENGMNIRSLQQLLAYANIEPYDLPACE